MGLSVLRVFFEIRLFLLTLISSAYLGQTCTMSPSVTESSGNASILQGSNHTFWCKGNGSYIIWDINGTNFHKNPVDSKLKVVDFEFTTKNDCVHKSLMTVHAENSSGSNTLTVFTIQCTLLSDSFPFFDPSKVAYLNVHVIGKVRDFELIPPVTSSKPAVTQWKAPYVFSKSSSPLHYNITVRDSSTQVIAQSTTVNTTYAIDSDLLVPCDSYFLTVLPFQQISTRVELGMMMQAVKNYSGTLLPATDIQSNVSMDSFAATATIRFQANFASCHLQWPEKFIVVLMQDGLNESDTFQPTEQIVQEGMNEYKLESLALRKKYQVSVKMENKYSSADSEFLNISTFEVQALSLEPVTNELNVRCVMADGAQKHCKVQIRSETGDIQRNCTKTNGASASCVLRGLPLGEYLVWAYDEGYNDSPAVTVVFNITEEPNEVLTDTTPTRDIATESSPSRVGGKEALQIVLPLGISVALVLAIAIIVFVSIVVAWRIKCYSSEKQNTFSSGNPPDSNTSETHELDLEAPRDELHVYKMADENEYHEGPLPLPEPAPLSNEHGLPSQHMLQEPAYAQPQIHTVIGTTVTADETSTGYKQHRKEWLVPRHSEGLTLPHTQDLDNAPETSSL